MLRRFYKISPLFFLILFLAGCSTTNKDGSIKPVDPANGFWDRYFVHPLSLVLDWFGDLFGGQYGLSILVVTIVIRLIILPLTLKQYRSSKAMQALQPELAKIKEKYKDDPKKQQEETMRLFTENKVNPMAGCFPILIQMPILIGLYHAIMRNPGIREHTFLWLQLGTPDPWILPIIAAFTTWLQQMMMMRTQANQMPQMKLLLYIFPVMIFFMSKSFASALPLYWIYSNIFTIIQNYFIYGTKPAVAATANVSAVEKPVKKQGKKASGKSVKKPSK